MVRAPLPGKEVNIYFLTMDVNSPPSPGREGSADREAPRGAPRRRQYRSRAERRREITEAALQILAERGPRGWTTALLAERVGVAEATLFKHFDSKADILVTAVGQQQARLQEWITGFRTEGTGWPGARSFLEALMAESVAGGGGPLVLLEHATRFPPELLERFAVTQQLLEGRVERFLAESPLEPVASDAARIGIAIVTRALLEWSAEERSSRPIGDAVRQLALVGRAFESADPVLLAAPLP